LKKGTERIPSRLVSKFMGGKVLQGGGKMKYDPIKLQKKTESRLMDKKRSDFLKIT